MPQIGQGRRGRSGTTSAPSFGIVARESAMGQPQPRVSQLKWTGIALAGEERHRLVERQADDVGVGADQPDDEAAGEALDGIAARLAAPFAGGEVAVDVLARQALEADPGLDQALADLALRR